MGEMFIVMIVFGGEEFLEIGEWIGGGELAGGLAEILDGGVAVGDLIDGLGSGGDEAVAADFFSAYDGFEKESVLLTAEDFEGGDGGEAVGEELAVDGDYFWAGGGDGGEFGECGEIAVHGWVEGKFCKEKGQRKCGLNRHDAKTPRDFRRMDISRYSSGMIVEPDEELDRLAHEVIGAAIEVHRILGPGFLESVYEEALIVELGLRMVTVQRQVPIPLVYKGVAIGQGRIDLLVTGKLIIEIKTVETLAPIHKAQAISYLKATGLQLALLINFNAAVLKDGIKRVVRS
jgi:GxxExxY protein